MAEGNNYSRTRKIQPSSVITMMTLAACAIGALLGPIHEQPLSVVFYLVALYIASELLSVQVSRIQSISPAPALLIHAVISHSLSLARDVVLIGGLIAAFISLVYPRIKSRTAAPRESSLSFLYSMSLHLLSIYGTVALFDIKLRLFPFIDANIFSRTLFFLLAFLLIKTLITLALVSLDQGSIVRYLRENLEILTYFGLLTNMFTKKTLNANITTPKNI